MLMELATSKDLMDLVIEGSDAKYYREEERKGDYKVWVSFLTTPYAFFI
jgi:hypothetical protein